VHGFRAKRELKEKIDNLFDNRCYRGVRHSYFLSVRGQRTRTNAKTQKNKKKKKIK
jgi:small subunit ribosomal protein S13